MHRYTAVVMKPFVNDVFVSSLNYKHWLNLFYLFDHCHCRAAVLGCRNMFHRVHIDIRHADSRLAIPTHNCCNATSHFLSRLLCEYWTLYTLGSMTAQL